MQTKCLSKAFVAKIMFRLIVYLQILLYHTATNSLSSSPPAVNGILTLCDGESFSITCTHGNTATGLTFWKFDPPLEDCPSRTVFPGQDPLQAHLQHCDPFTFTNIKRLQDIFSSTVEADARPWLNNMSVQCRDSAGNDYVEVGNVILCVVGKLLSYAPSKLYKRGFYMLEELSVEK